MRADLLFCGVALHLIAFFAQHLPDVPKAAHLCVDLAIAGQRFLGAIDRGLDFGMAEWLRFSGYRYSVGPSFSRLSTLSGGGGGRQFGLFLFALTLSLFGSLGRLFL